MSKVRDFLIISRAPLLIGSLANPLIGTALGAGTIAAFLSAPVLAYFALYYVLIIFACNINCLFDIEVDSRHKSFMSRAAQSFGTRNLKLLLGFELLAILWLVSWLFSEGYLLTAIISLLGFVFGLIYSAEPPRIKKRGFWSPFPVLIGLYTLPLLGGWFLFQNTLPPYFLLFVAGYALINEGITLVNTVEDHSEDEQEGISTWSHIFGMRNTLALAFIFSALGFGTVISLFSLPSISLITAGLLALSTLAIFIVVRQVAAAGRADDLEKSAKLHARKMPKWFVMVRYPLLITAISMLA
jgi:4-hydroxybenzoate polyprenyltransferase